MKITNKVRDGFTSDTFWNYHPTLPLKFAPYFSTRISFKECLVYWLRTWRPNGTQFLFLPIAILVWLYATPSLSRTANFDIDWVIEIWLRNMALILVVAGGLHLWLHTFNKQGFEKRYDKRPLNKNGKRFHFNSQTKDNVFWSLGTGVLLWTAWESLMLWCFSNGYIQLINIGDNPIWFIVLILLVPIWALVFFYLQHRVMHTPFLYKHIHSWHHKNGNTGPWSGLAMHPIEQLVLMADNLVYFLLACHPVHIIYGLMFHGLGAPTSHSGFESVKIGRVHIQLSDFFHQLHHRFFDCNYGCAETPWDLWNETFHDGTKEGHRDLMAKRK